MSTAWSTLEVGLSALGVLDPRKPRSYLDGATVPTTVPVQRPVPPPVPSGPLPVEAHPDDVEPGLMEELFGGGLTMEAVETVLDEMVRPALNADGGDIALVRIVGADVHVRLVGACNTCPSSTITMRMGVERLLQEEFPEMGELVQVDDFGDPI